MPRAQIKDERRYRRLREQGEPKEKAARIANTPRSQAARRGGASKKYEMWTKRELYRRAKEIGIEGRSQMSKKELIRAIRHR